MDYPESRKWAIVSHITTLGWIVAVIATSGKKRSRLLCCYLNNAIIISLYSSINQLIQGVLKDHEAVPLTGSITIVLQQYWIIMIYILSLVFHLLFLVPLFSGLYFAMKGQERRFPYLFRIKFFESFNVFEPVESFDAGESQKNQYNYIKYNEKSNYPISEGTVKSALKCPSCGNEISINAKFCRHCGTGLITKPKIRPSTCSKCGNKLVEGSLFCHNCGTKTDVPD